MVLLCGVKAHRAGGRLQIGGVNWRTVELGVSFISALHSCLSEWESCTGSQGCCGTPAPVPRDVQYCNVWPWSLYIHWWWSWQSAGLGFRRPEFWSNSATGCWGNSIKSPFFSVSCFSLKKRWAIQRAVRIWRCSLRKLVCECSSRPEPQLQCLSWIHVYIPRLEVMLFSSNINHTSIPSPLQCRQPRYLKIEQISLHKICSAEFTQPLCLSKGCKKQLCSSKFLNSSSCLTREI